jgi:small subunit ribosomal protein S8
MQDFLGDMFTRIRNGHRARLGAVILHPSTPQLCLRVLNILTEEGYIRGFCKVLENKKTQSSFCVFLKYDTNGVPVIQSIFRVSKPTRRIYISLKSLWKPKNTTGIFILSTVEGLMVDREARQRNLGGEVICGLY